MINDPRTPTQLDNHVPAEILSLLSMQAPGPELRTFRQDVKKAVVAVVAWGDERQLAVNCATQDQAAVVRQVGELLRRRMRVA